MVGMIILNCNMGKYFMKLRSWGQLASWSWREPELHSRLAALVQAVSTNWYLTSTGLRYVHGITKFHLRPSLPQSHIVWYRSGKRSFPCHTSIFLLVLLLLLPPFFVFFHVSSSLYDSISSSSSSIYAGIKISNSLLYGRTNLGND